jgi:hypothetical protein
MKNTMILTFAAAAVAAAGAFATFGADTAVAARSVSPFAGEYVGPRPGAYSQDDWGSIVIGSDGRIVGTLPPASTTEDRFTGAVRNDGTYEIANGTWNPNKMRNWVKDVSPSPAETGLTEGTIKLVTTGTITLGTDGNLYGTASYAVPFVWRRK